MNDSWPCVADEYGDMGEIDPLWNIADDFSVTDAAALVAGYNPTSVERCKGDTFFCEALPRYPIALKALTHAITNGKLQAAIRHAAREYGYADQMADVDYSECVYGRAFGTTSEEDEALSSDHSCFYKAFPDWALSTISRDELVRWLESRGVRSGFFFPTASDAPDYLDPSNPRYAPKLAAAVRAWQAMGETNGKTPKQALVKWLREHAASFGMTDDEGTVNETGIEEAAKVANWQTGGGAPKTPGT